jgi:hypothetical protein
MCCCRVAHQEVQDPLAEGVIQSHGPDHSDDIGGHYDVECLAVVNEQHSHIGVPLVQLEEGIGDLRICWGGLQIGMCPECLC